MMRFLVKPTGLAVIAVMAVFIGCAAVASPAASDGSALVCASVPAETGGVLDASVATAEDVQAFHQAVKGLTIVLDTLCRQDRTALKRIKNQAKSVVFEMSAGATEPTPYLNDGRLIVEFYGGIFDAQAFRQTVRKVLLGQKIPHND